jgi:putative beta-lysine N-acetyltransferase
MIDNKTQQDEIKLFDNALIQHGPLSNRIYIMKLNHACPKILIKRLDKLAADNGYTKIFAKIPAHQADEFINSGYQQEAEVSGFYHGQEAALFLGRYLDPDRQKEVSLLDIESIVDVARKKDKTPPDTNALPHGAILRWCVPMDAKRISELYREVFPSYPFPIGSPKYITDTMLDHIVYFGIEIDKRFIALSSAEMDTVSKNVEMTDFATLPKYRGNNFSGLLLAAMEKEMKNRGILTAYTIARAISPGINMTFAKAGYTYGGRLINNTNISGQIESMNIWYKSLHE